MHKKLEEICQMGCTLTDWAKCEIGKGMKDCDTKELGMVIDMIKDICEAEEKVHKACYYKELTKVMKEYGEDLGEEEEVGERYGYDTRRYSSGRYAPKGRGHYSPVHGMGYPMHDKMFPEMFDPNQNFSDMMPMGYSRGGGNSGGGNGSSGSSSGGSRGGSSSGGSSGGSYGYGYPNMNRSEYGMSYDNYRNARKHYTASKSEGDRGEMNTHAKNHVMEAADSIKEIWKNSDDQSLKKEIKASLSALVGEMTV